MNRTARYAALAALFIVLLLMPVIIQGAYHMHIAIMALVNIALALSLWLILRTGQLSIGHAAFMAVGAYTSALVTMRLDMPFWIGLVAAGAMSAVIAVAIGYVTLRLKGLYFALATFAFAEIVRLVLTSVGTDLFGGPQGITGIPKPSFFGYELSTNDHFYYLALALAVLSFLLVLRFDRSRIGTIFSAISQADSLAESVGINIMKYKVIAFVTGSFIAGVMGSFFAHYFAYISPDHFNFWVSVYVLIYVVVGGTGTVIGPVIGTAILSFVSAEFRSFADYEPIVFGASLVLVLLFLPEGVVSLPGKLLPPTQKVVLRVREYFVRGRVQGAS